MAFSQDVLIRTGRYCNVDWIKQCIIYSQDMNIHVGVDLIIGLPGTSFDECKNNLDAVFELVVKNVFIYPYRLEKNSAFYNAFSRINRVQEKEIVTYLDYIKSRMLGKNYIDKTIYYWTMERVDRYLYSQNQIYGGEWIGIGAGAYSYINGTVFHNDTDIKKYLTDPGISDNCDIFAQNITAQIAWDITFMIKNSSFASNVIIAKYGRIVEQYLKMIESRLGEKEYCDFSSGDMRLNSNGKANIDIVNSIIREIVLE